MFLRMLDPRPISLSLLLGGGCLLSETYVGDLPPDGQAGSEGGDGPDATAGGTGPNADAPGCVENCPGKPTWVGEGRIGPAIAACDGLVDGDGVIESFINLDLLDGPEFVGGLAIDGAATVISSTAEGSWLMAVAGRTDAEIGSVVRTTPSRDAIAWTFPIVDLGKAGDVCSGLRPRYADVAELADGRLLLYTGMCSGPEIVRCEEPDTIHFHLITADGGLVEAFHFVRAPVIGRSGLAVLADGTVVAGANDPRGPMLLQSRTGAGWSRVDLVPGAILVELEPAPHRGLYTLSERDDGRRELTWLDDGYAAGATVENDYIEIAVSPEGLVVGLAESDGGSMGRVDGFDAYLEPIWTLDLESADELPPIAPRPVFVSVGAGGRLFVGGSTAYGTESSAWFLEYGPAG